MRHIGQLEASGGFSCNPDLRSLAEKNEEQGQSWEARTVATGISNRRSQWRVGVLQLVVSIAARRYDEHQG